MPSLAVIEERCKSWSDTDRRDVVILLLLLGSMMTYLPVIGFSFLTYDDPGYVVNNPYVNSGLSMANLVWAFTVLHGDVSYWHPVTWISHQLDAHVFGLRPGAHHFTNVIIHSAAGAMLFLFLRQCTGSVGRSAVVAALFLLHPLRVESVAWIAERKDVLAGFFWFSTLLAYGWYAQSPSYQRWFVAWLLFLLGCMSKPSMVTLPLVLFLLDFWPLNRWQALAAREGGILSNAIKRKRLALLVGEKIPFLLASLLVGLAAIWAQKSIGAVASTAALPISHRLDNTFVSYALYLWKTVWPESLTPAYWVPAWPFWQVAGSAAILICLSVFAWRWRWKAPWFIVGWAWFVVVLIPMIGLLQVGAQHMADRYTYVSGVGLLIIIVWSGNELMRRMGATGIARGMVSISLIGGCVVQTRSQLQHWENGESIFSHAVRIMPENWLAQHNLGLALAGNGKGVEAERAFLAALRIVPGEPKILRALASVILERGETAKAIDLLAQAAAVPDNDTEAHFQLGWIYATHPDAAFRNGDKAYALAKHILSSGQRIEPKHLELLGAAEAERENFTEALEAARLALLLAEAARIDTRRIHAQFRLYESNQVLRAPLGRFITPVFSRHEEGKLEEHPIDGVPAEKNDLVEGEL
jgi:protein O-mannosyl-transferase